MPETCELCCEEFSAADEAIPLDCPTKTCHFHYCSTCLRQMLQSASEGYTEASDGSRQLKTSVYCPQCRAPYKKEKKESSTHVPKAVLLLRRCYEARELLSQDDSLLSAGELTQKYDLMHSVHYNDVLAAAKTLTDYQQYHDMEPPLSLDLQEFQILEGGSTITTTTTIHPDPSLFHGLHDLLTKDEQLYLTKLFVSGDMHKVAQAALLLETLSQSSTTTNTITNESVTIDMAQLTKFKARHPLPTRMPLCVTVPAEELKQFKFEKDRLVLKRVAGVAGRNGLRRGDLVTHVQGESVESVEDLVSYDRGVVAVVVNVTPETVSLLQKRSLEIGGSSWSHVSVVK